MLGAIVGDIVGSRFEFNNHRSTDFELFGPGTAVTDDSIMTLAVAAALMDAYEWGPPHTTGFDERLTRATVFRLREIGRHYPDCGYGNRFYAWIFGDRPEPYNSFGNGAAMRISPVGQLRLNDAAAVNVSNLVTGVSHNHPEGLKGAEAVVMAMRLTAEGVDQSTLRDFLRQNYYALDFTLDSIRATYTFNETCQETVPQALTCYLEADSFESAIRNAVSIGGDSDTLAAIAGSVAEMAYGVPDNIRAAALSYLDDRLLTLYERWQAFCREDRAACR